MCQELQRLFLSFLSSPPSLIYPLLFPLFFLSPLSSRNGLIFLTIPLFFSVLPLPWVLFCSFCLMEPTSLLSISTSPMSGRDSLACLFLPLFPLLSLPLPLLLLKTHFFLPFLLFPPFPSSAKNSCGSLTFCYHSDKEIAADSEDMFAVAGANLLTDTPEIAGWLTSLKLVFSFFLSLEQLFFSFSFPFYSHFLPLLFLLDMIPPLLLETTPIWMVLCMFR